MRRLVMSIGALLVILSFVILFTFVVLPAVIPFKSFPPLKTVFQVAFCKPNENIVDSRSTFSEPGRSVTSVTYQCINDEGQARDISGAPIVAGMVGYFIPFFVGLFMVIGAANSGKQFRTTSSAYFSPSASPLTSFQQSGQGFTVNRAGMEITVDPNGEVMVKMPDGRILKGDHSQFGLSSAMTTHINEVKSTTSRLQDLKSALDQGLITQAEFDSKRQEILREM